MSSDFIMKNNTIYYRIEPNSMESILCEAIKLEFEAYTSLTNLNNSSRELNEVLHSNLYINFVKTGVWRCI